MLEVCQEALVIVHDILDQLTDHLWIRPSIDGHYVVQLGHIKDEEVVDKLLVLLYAKAIGL